MSLRAMAEDLKLGISTTTLYRRIRATEEKLLKWFELTKRMKAKNNWGFLMGLDTTPINIGGHEFTILTVYDITSRDPLVYQILMQKDVITLKPVLLKLRSIGYIPRIVVMDLAPELLAVIGQVYPETKKIQWCLFHVEDWLDKRLPTKYAKEKIDRKTRLMYKKVKKILLRASQAKDQESRNHILSKLKELNLDFRVDETLALFRENIDHLFTLDELPFIFYQFSLSLVGTNK
jgi:hypothetical protein